ncbi:hypothetical protein C8A03DRAFT_35094 [Achaetomium macrosporum]|uniref:RING-type domain-containing protein n=1 Tax=Achaetomium macrosporum TaxID=79813 RepID=A0AAN7C8Q5_9PEZI|nr:hypothetical protein C8A03DRAFT_35094 [Achaetomium macrosporum]
MANTTEEMGCYAPDPKRSFIFGPVNLVCVICTESKLTLASSYKHVGDSNPSLLPCGHVFGEECLQFWLKDHDTCPVCRYKLQYELCEHPIRPRRLTWFDIMFVPRTIPDGGTVGTQCAPCKRETDRRVAAELWFPLAEKYYKHKLACERRGISAADNYLVVKAKEALDKMVAKLAPQDDQQW